MTIHGTKTTQAELFAQATRAQLAEINEFGADTVTVTALLLEMIFGANTYSLEHWEGLEMCFVNDEGHCVTVNELSLEVYSY